MVRWCFGAGDTSNLMWCDQKNNNNNNCITVPHQEANCKPSSLYIEIFGVRSISPKQYFCVNSTGNISFNRTAPPLREMSKMTCSILFCLAWRHWRNFNSVFNCAGPQITLCTFLRAAVCSSITHLYPIYIFNQNVYHLVTHRISGLLEPASNESWSNGLEKPCYIHGTNNV